jgi:hypothetical protein
VAGFAGGFSLSVGEEYNDNIFFSNQKNKKDEHDFITHLVPTFSLFYVPPLEISPTFTANLSPSGQIFAHHSDLDNFGDNVSFNTDYIYRYSPRLTFHVGDGLSRTGKTRTIALEALGGPPQLPSTPTMFPAPGGIESLPLFQDIVGLVSAGGSLTNFFSVDGAFLYAPQITISGSYSTGYTNRSIGSETSHSIGVRGIYNYRQEHNLHAGYTVTINSGNGASNSNGGSNVIHSFDIGDDYFSNFRIQLDPTLILSGSTGVGLNTGGKGPAVANNLNLTLIKLWERAVFSAAVRRGLTSSAGISAGPSLTTTLSSVFNIRLTERLTGILGLQYDIFETADVNFQTFRAGAGLHYWITNWLSSNLWYSHRWLNSGSGAGSADLVASGKVSGNSIILAFSAHFDVWPNVGLARGPTRPLYAPPGVPPFAVVPVTPQPVTPSPVTPQSPTSP